VSLTKGKEKTVNGVTHKGPFFFYGHSKDNCTRQQNEAAKAAKKALLAGTSGPTASAAAQPPASKMPSNNDLASMQNAHNAFYAQLYHQQNADALSMMSNATTQLP
jgi:hypothetical protein